jgi:hypothetical protein
LFPALLTLPTIFLCEINIIGSCRGARIAPPAQLGFGHDSQARHEASGFCYLLLTRVYAPTSPPSSLPALLFDPEARVTMTEATITPGPCEIKTATKIRNLDDELVVTPEKFASIPDERSELCSDCATIDFDQIMQLDEVTSDEGEPIRELGNANDLDSSSCPLCWFWGRNGPCVEEEQSPTDLIKDGRPGRNSRYLRAFNFNKTFIGLSPEVLKKVDRQASLLGVVRKPPSIHHLLKEGNYKRFSELVWPVFLALEETGYICLSNIKRPLRTMSTRLINSEHADLDVVRRWLNHCRDNHGAVCGRTTTSPSALKVIDCVTRKIIEAPDECKYVALSYIWGQPPLQPPTSGVQTLGEDLPQLPKTIEDSIGVTKELGLRYLWIDKYCIDQSDKEEKHRHIHQMDLIYAGAEVTIIAAAGENPDHGLCGFNGTPRNLQMSLRLGDYLLTETLPHPGKSVEWSEWSTRAWTYQEAVLSRRRLVFTSDQVLWECDSMSCAESAKVPLDLLHTVVREKDISLAGTCFPFKHPGTDPGNMWSFIGQYFQKNMSYREDKLSAMQGIFKCFEKANLPARNLSGVPIFDPRIFELDLSASDLFLYNLQHGIRHNKERMPEYPSWSWAGWHGGWISQFDVGLQHLDLPERELPGLEFPALWIESVTGGFEAFPENVGSPEEWASINMDAKFLEIEAWTVPCSIVYSDPGPPEHSERENESEGIYVRLPANGTEYGYSQISLSSREDRRQVKSGTFSKPCLGLVIPMKFKKSRLIQLIIMVVGQNGDFWERMGHFKFRFLKPSYGAEIRGEFVHGNDTKTWLRTVPKTKRRIRLG